MPLLEYKPADKAYYEREIQDFLPERVIDAHAHVYSREHRDPSFVETLTDRSQNWPNLVAADNPMEDLEETYRILFPGKQVTPVVFGMPTLRYFWKKSNEYLARESQKTGYPALMLTPPALTAEELEEGLVQGGFRGAKVYLDYAPAYIPGKEIRIFDFAPHHQLEVLNALGSVLMLHIPRPGRLKDPVNIEQMLEIDRRYPNIKLIIAHIGRAYAMEDLGGSLDILKDSHMWIDFSANTNQQVFEETLKKIGAERMLFGSDLPIVRMRVKRIVENGVYINIVPKGSYGDISGDPHMRETEGKEADSLSFFLYEIIVAMRRACETVGASRADVDAMFFGNAAALFGLTCS